jgi:hypothetical protein
MCLGTRTNSPSPSGHHFVNGWRIQPPGRPCADSSTNGAAYAAGWATDLLGDPVGRDSVLGNPMLALSSSPDSR